MELVDILVLGTSAAKRVGSNPTEGIYTIEHTNTHLPTHSFIVQILLNT